MIAETNRHAGHADIVRELIDGAAGLRDDNDNMPPGDPAWWESYRSRLERVAQGRPELTRFALTAGRLAVLRAVVLSWWCRLAVRWARRTGSRGHQADGGFRSRIWQRARLRCDLRPRRER